MDIKPIQTYFNGDYFRSRLEAKWAVFFEHLNIEYEYEKEGYDLGGGYWYLPDFYLPDQDCFIEIKGQRPSDEEELKALTLANGLDKRVFIFFGNIPNPEKIESHGFVSDNAYAFFGGGGEDYSYHWCECAECGLIGIEFDGRSARLKCKCNFGCDKEYNAASNSLKTAYAIARNYDFRSKKNS